MLTITKRAKNVSPSLTLAITAKANKMKAELENIKLEKEFMTEGFTSEETSKLMKSNFSAKSFIFLNL